MKFTLDIQFFASKKGVSSTKNGRDSAGRRLGAKKADGQYTNAGSIVREAQRSTQARMLCAVEMIHCLQQLQVSLSMSVLARIRNRFLFILKKLNLNSNGMLLTGSGAFLKERRFLDD